MSPMDLSVLAVSDVSHAMQLALGPVFLLNGIGVLLAMLTNRLARIIDRARNLEARLAAATPEEGPALKELLAFTSRRARLVNRAITLGTFAALLVALVVALLFAAAFVSIPTAPAVAVMFVTCMAALAGALLCFLIEVRIATQALRFGPQN
jgi:hypothetical protein